jgi:hypothetical protein
LDVYRHVTNYHHFIWCFRARIFLAEAAKECKTFRNSSLLNLNNRKEPQSTPINGLNRGLSCDVFEYVGSSRVYIPSCFNEPKARLRHVLRATLRVRVEYPSNSRSALKVAYAGFLRNHLIQSRRYCEPNDFSTLPRPPTGCPCQQRSCHAPPPQQQRMHGPHRRRR